MTMQSNTPSRGGSRAGWFALPLGCLVGAIGMLVLVVGVGMPLAIAHRTDLPLERLYGDVAVSLASRQGGNTPNPLGANPRAVEAGRNAYTGSCAVCHGANGDGRGAFGDGLYPPASDLRAHDTQEKSDAQLFWILKNGLSFAGMPAFGQQYDDQTLWALVSYMRTLPKGSGALAVPTPDAAQLALADPNGDPVHRGAAVYFAQGCDKCHGAVGNAPGELRLRGADREAQQVIRRGRQGMPAYNKTQVTDAELNDLVAYMGTFSGQRR